MARYDAYVICTAPRSGSTLLCRLLAATGVAGRPDSYFHSPSVADWREALNLPRDFSGDERAALAATAQAAIREGAGETGMFGLRLQRHSFAFFTAKLAVLHPDQRTDQARIEAAFGRTKFLHLSRRDKVEQAVSLVKAQQTGLWHQAPDGTEIERLSPPQAPRYDAEAIAAAVAEFTAHDQDWAAWFAAEGIAPLRLAYERLAADPAGVLGEVLAALHLDRAAARGAAPPVAKLADAVNADWAARFRAERGGAATS